MQTNIEEMFKFGEEVFWIGISELKEQKKYAPVFIYYRDRFITRKRLQVLLRLCIY